MGKYILALDQGTSSSRAIVFNHSGDICSVAQKEFTQHFPKPGWVEHDPKEIWSSQYSVMLDALRQVGTSGGDIAAIGITNQRETTIVWDAATGEPIYNAIVWQDRRTSEYCDSLKKQKLTDEIRQKTGLIIDAYFSGTKIRWILENVPGASPCHRREQCQPHHAIQYQYAPMGQRITGTTEHSSLYDAGSMLQQRNLRLYPVS